MSNGMFSVIICGQNNGYASAAGDDTWGPVVLPQAIDRRAGRIGQGQSPGPIACAQKDSRQKAASFRACRRDRRR